jgi:hypothetical protein
MKLQFIKTYSNETHNFWVAELEKHPKYLYEITEIDNVTPTEGSQYPLATLNEFNYSGTYENSLKYFGQY